MSEKELSDIIYVRCPICGKANTTTHICEPPICPKCGKTNTPIHDCTPTILPTQQYCTNCGKPNTINHMCLVRSHKCPNCEKATHDCYCKICGKVYAENIEHRHRHMIEICQFCGKIIVPGVKHVCPGIPIKKCPRCGGPLGSCNCFVINPQVPRDDLLVQKVIAEADIGKHFSEGWAFKVQLQSGSVIVEKAVDAERIVDAVLEQARKQIEDTVAKADVEVVTEKVLEQANKQIEEAIALEKQRLQKT